MQQKVKEKPKRTKKFLVKKKHPDGRTKNVKKKQKPGDGMEIIKEETGEVKLSEISPETLQEQEVYTNGDMKEYVDDDGVYYYYTDDQDGAEVKRKSLF